MSAASPHKDPNIFLTSCTRWPYFTKGPEEYRNFMKSYFYFMIEGFAKPFGYIHRGFVRQLEWPDFWEVDMDKRFVTLTSGTDFNTRSRLV